MVDIAGTVEPVGPLGAVLGRSEQGDVGIAHDRGPELFDPVGPGEGIGIEENHPATGALPDETVVAGGKTEIGVALDELHPVGQVGRGNALALRGSVLEHQNLAGPDRLVRQRVEAAADRFAAAIGDDMDRNLRRLLHLPLRLCRTAPKKLGQTG